MVRRKIKDQYDLNLTVNEFHQKLLKDQDKLLDLQLEIEHLLEITKQSLLGIEVFTRMSELDWDKLDKRVRRLVESLRDANY